MNKRKLAEGLTEGFIHCMWRLENPVPEINEQEKMITKYRDDYLFHNRVQCMVSFAMREVQDWLNEEIEK